MSRRTRSPEYLVGRWPLNGHADDVSGYGNHGTLVNIPTWATFNRNRVSCIEFDGDDAYVNLGDLTQLNAVSAFSIAFWMNQDVLDQTDFIFNKAIDAFNEISIFSFNTGFFFADISTDGVNAYGRFDYSTVISARNWHHMAVIFDGLQVGDVNRLMIYVDGTPVTLAFVGGIPALTHDLVGVDATIGAASNSFDGKLFDFRIYSVPLTRDEVRSVMRGHD